MSVEKDWIYNEIDKEKRRLSEKDKMKEVKKQIEYKRIKEKIEISKKSEDDIFYLKELIKKWLITKKTAEKIISWEKISKDEINQIFEKIDQIESIKNIDNYLPVELRIKKDEYLRATEDDIFREQILTKIDSALILISKKLSSDFTWWLSLFLWFLNFLDRNLIIIQENNIDIKSSLKKISEKKFPKKQNNKNFLQKIIDFIKEIFNQK